MLKRYKIPHKYFTTTIGINELFQSHPYYDRVLWRDYQRVMDKFATAENDGIVVEQKRISHQDILKHLALNGPIIVLTNGPQLVCNICSNKSIADELR